MLSLWVSKGGTCRSYAGLGPGFKGSASWPASWLILISCWVSSAFQCLRGKYPQSWPHQVLLIPQNTYLENLELGVDLSRTVLRGICSPEGHCSSRGSAAPSSPKTSGTCTAPVQDFPHQSMQSDGSFAAHGAMHQNNWKRGLRFLNPSDFCCCC